MEPHLPKPKLRECPTCNAEAVSRSLINGGRLQHFVGCSNELDCPVWPVTGWHPTPEAAGEAWNRGEVS